MQRLSTQFTQSTRARARVCVCVCVCRCIGRPNREVYNVFEFAKTIYSGRGQKDVAVCTMDIDGGTFHCATMLCGNNAQTNDSVVAVVITGGVRWVFPLLSYLSSLFS